MKRYSWVIIAAGILLILYPIIGNLYVSYRQRYLLKQVAVLQVGEENNYQSGNVSVDEFQNAFPDENYEEADQKSSEASTENKDVTPVPETAAQTPAPAPAKPEVKPIGVLTIKKINLTIPVLEGVSEDVLRIGAGHFPGTAGIGGSGNTALAAHRSYTFGKFFNRLDELEKGDEIIISSNNKAFEYEVYDKKVILPTDLSVLAGDKRDKIISLITCHPPRESTYRLVVQARIKQIATP